MQEIERKWEIRVLPKDLKSSPCIELTAGYFEGSDKKDVRIRREGNKYLKVIKSGQGIAKDIGQGDLEITKKEFDSLWPKTKDRRLRKLRCRIPYKGFVIELDIYQDFKGFYTAEVEFKTIKDAKKFVPPGWFGRELTDKKEYSSNSLATNGFPRVSKS